VDSAYVTYWSLQDPLCQSQSLPVVRALAALGWRMALVTFEQSPWGLADADRRGTQAALLAQGVTWLPLDYHKRPRLLATAYDVGRGALRLRGLATRQGVRLLHSRGSVPAGMALAAVRTTRARFFYDADGPLSQEYVDAGLWSSRSPGFRLARSAEDAALARADRVAVLSTLRRDEVQSRVRSPVAVLPCGIDTARFQRDESRGQALRAELGLQGTVLVYAGKSGGWYLTEPLLDFVREAERVLGTVTLLVLTGEEPAAFLQGAQRRGVRCVVKRAAPADMPAYLSAAQAGLSFRSPSPSQRASSPIKNGEYLSCGLPVVSTAVAGDYPALLRRENVGVVVEDLASPGLAGAAQALGVLLADPGLGARCRRAALRHVDLHGVVIPRYREIYRELLGEP
jgi:glycosyltransferase involved in cell wall biosynthesis